MSPCVSEHESTQVAFFDSDDDDEDNEDDEEDHDEDDEDDCGAPSAPDAQGSGDDAHRIAVAQLAKTLSRDAAAAEAGFAEMRVPRGRAASAIAPVGSAAAALLGNRDDQHKPEAKRRCIGRAQLGRSALFAACCLLKSPASVAVRVLVA